METVTASNQVSGAGRAGSESLPVLLYFNDFPPSNANGGTVLVRRLLSGYPSQRLVGLTSAQAEAILAMLGRTRLAGGLVTAEDWCGCHKIFPSILEVGRLGMARLKGLLNWMLIPAAAFYATRLIRRQSVSVMLSVTAGTYFLAAGMASRWAKTPLILIAHDDWVPIVSDACRLPQGIFHSVMGRALRRASHIFAVSAGMQEMLKAQYGVDSEIQMPATEPWPAEPSPQRERQDGAFRILYMGNGVAAQDSLKLLIQLVGGQTLRKHGLENVELHLCTPYRVDAPGVRHHGWVTEAGARQQIAEADLLFLPYGFGDGDRPVALTSFPAKSADYFASGKPVLAMGPKDSTIVRHAEKYRCADLVTELNPDALAQAIARVALDGAHRRDLVANAQRAFEESHNIIRQQERLFEVVRSLTARKKT